MYYPPEIADILLGLIRTALLRIRAQGWSGNNARCAMEADHVHNLPDLLCNFSPEKLRYYWEAARPAMLHEIGEEDMEFQDLWDRLAVHVDASATTATH